MGVEVKEGFSPMRIGLMADSHGSVQALYQGIRTLKSLGVDQLFHLGDFCDSVYRNHLPEIFSILVSEGILTVMGNNDYQIQTMLNNGYSPGNGIDTRRFRHFLEQTPIIRRIQHICLAHSLPYNALRSIYDPIDDGTTDRALSIFSSTDYSAVFCGHSHVPILFRYRDGQVTREGVDKSKPVVLDPDERYIIIVGSALKGECGVYDTGRKYYERIHV